MFKEFDEILKEELINVSENVDELREFLDNIDLEKLSFKDDKDFLFILAHILFLVDEDISFKDIDYFGYSVIAVFNKAVSDLKKRVKNDLIEVGIAKFISISITIFQNIKKIHLENLRDKRNYNKPKGWMSLAVLDSRTTDLCRSLHQHIYYIPNRKEVPNRPPRHINCRSILVPFYDKTPNSKDLTLESFYKRNL